MIIQFLSQLGLILYFLKIPQIGDFFTKLNKVIFKSEIF